MTKNFSYADLVTPTIVFSKGMIKLSMSFGVLFSSFQEVQFINVIPPADESVYIKRVVQVTLYILYFLLLLTLCHDI